MTEAMDLQKIRERLGFPPREAHHLTSEWRQIVLDLCEDNARLAAELAGARQQNQNLRDGLGNLEWGGEAWDDEECRFCYGTPEDGHSSDCELAVLARLGGGA